MKPFSGNYSDFDLIIYNPFEYMDFSWDVKVDTYGNDHFPILLENTENISCLKLNKVNQDTLKTSAKKTEHKKQNKNSLVRKISKF